ncbi:MAG: hypothetical protein K2G37_06550 [Clostridia bacterium]|nr:hypothetical protein [Clostridia bacterium]MDE7329448.1 hypothetical protein [Clostridia bacterium]
MKIFINERCSDMRAAKEFLLKEFSKSGKPYSIKYLPSGQPTLILDGKPSGYISISHTGATLVMAFSDKPIGVDIELRDRKTSRIGMDIENWTKCEAYGKYLGVGINKEILKADLPQELVKTFKRGEYVVSVCGEGELEEVVAFIDNGKE